MSRFSDALITRVVVQGFRSLEHVAVDLGPVTVDDCCMRFTKSTISRSPGPRTRTGVGI